VIASKNDSVFGIVELAGHPSLTLIAKSRRVTSKPKMPLST
jgi:hypothetical protein